MQDKQPRILHRPANGWARTRTEQSIEALAGMAFLAGCAIFISDLFGAAQIIIEWAGSAI